MSPIALPWIDEPKFRCFGCSPHNRIGLALQMSWEDEGRLATEVTFSEDYASYPGVVHGGIVSVLVDELMGDLLALEYGMLAFSVSLRTKFLMPLRIGESYRAVAQIAKGGNGLIQTECDVSSLDKELHVMASATYQPIRSAQASSVMGLHGADLKRLSHYFDHEIGSSK